MSENSFTNTIPISFTKFSFIQIFNPTGRDAYCRQITSRTTSEMKDQNNSLQLEGEFEQISVGMASRL